MLLPRVERARGGWLGQGWRNVPPEHPFNSGAAAAGLHRGEETPPPRPPLHPSGSRMAADQVSVRGSASCRQGFGRPWGAGRGGCGRGQGGGGRCYYFPKKHFTAALSRQPPLMTAAKKQRLLRSLTFVLSWHETRRDMRSRAGRRARKPAGAAQCYNAARPLSSFRLLFTS